MPIFNLLIHLLGRIVASSGGVWQMLVMVRSKTEALNKSAGRGSF